MNEAELQACCLECSSQLWHVLSWSYGVDRELADRAIVAAVRALEDVLRESSS